MIGVIQPVISSPLHTITTPVLVLQGSRDTFLPPVAAGLLYERLTGSACRRVRLFEGYKHWLSQEVPEHRAAVAEEVVGWLRARARAGGSGGCGGEGCDASAGCGGGGDAAAAAS